MGRKWEKAAAAPDEPTTRWLVPFPAATSPSTHTTAERMLAPAALPGDKAQEAFWGSCGNEDANSTPSVAW